MYAPESPIAKGQAFIKGFIIASSSDTLAYLYLMPEYVQEEVLDACAKQDAFFDPADTPSMIEDFPCFDADVVMAEEHPLYFHAKRAAIKYITSESPAVSEFIERLEFSEHSAFHLGFDSGLATTEGAVRPDSDRYSPELIELLVRPFEDAPVVTVNYEGQLSLTPHPDMV